MSEIKIINSADIDISNEIVYFGWTEADIKNYKTSYQTTFLGFPEDMILEVTTCDEQIYYAIFRSGESLKYQRQFLLADKMCFIIVNANGILYRFDSIERKCLDISCYSNIKLNSAYFASDVSLELGIMTIVDDEGVAVINWNSVLWKKNFRYAYADNLKVSAISQQYVLLEYGPPDDSAQFIKLDTYTGEVRS